MQHCIFCNLLLPISISSISLGGLDYYHCSPCKAQILFDAKSNEVYKAGFGVGTYSIIINYKDKISTIVHGAKSSTIEEILNITPQTPPDKIKLYLLLT